MALDPDENSEYAEETKPDHTGITTEHGLRLLLNSPEGRVFLFDLLYHCCEIDRPAFSVNAASRDYTLGRQAIGLEITERLQMLNPHWHFMLNESIGDLKE